MKAKIIGLFLSLFLLLTNCNFSKQKINETYPLFLKVVEYGDPTEGGSEVIHHTCLGIIELNQLKLKVKFPKSTIETIDLDSPLDYFNFQDKTSMMITGVYHQKGNSYLVEVWFIKDKFADDINLEFGICPLHQTKAFHWYCKTLQTERELEALRDDILKVDKNQSLEELFKK
jgi:hypothetical protein